MGKVYTSILLTRLIETHENGLEFKPAVYLFHKDGELSLPIAEWESGGNKWDEWKLSKNAWEAFGEVTGIFVHPYWYQRAYHATYHPILAPEGTVYKAYKFKVLEDDEEVLKSILGEFYTLEELFFSAAFSYKIAETTKRILLNSFSKEIIKLYHQKCAGREKYVDKLV